MLGAIEILDGGFWPFNTFVNLKIAFSKHRLMKISMIYAYIKPQIKKYDTTAITVAISEACIGWLHKVVVCWGWCF